MTSDASTRPLIVVNANAKRGGRRIAAELSKRLPHMRVAMTRSVDELDALLREQAQDTPVFAAGGDGTAISLANALDRAWSKPQRLPPIGILPLGTGNAWARVSGVSVLDDAVARLAGHRGPLPTRAFSLARCEGQLSHFCGSGWDAEILDAYKRQLEHAHGPMKRVAKSVGGYLIAVFRDTIPRSLVRGLPHVRVETLDGEVFLPDANGRIHRLVNVKPGDVIYDGPAAVAGAATCPEFGYRFRAYPFAERLLNFLHVRVYGANSAVGAVSIPKLWVGDARLPKMNDWLMKRVRFTFNRPVAFQSAGDAWGMRETCDIEADDRLIDVVDWRQVDRLND
jgi:hypothetical protein